MYESPLSIIYGEIQTKIIEERENQAIQALQNCGISVDKEELIKALMYDRQQYEKGYADAKAEEKWIPCSDPSDLPKDKRLWITREISDGFFTLREASDVIWDMTEWSGSVSNVVAYMPYWEPEPYKERLEE